MGKKYSEEIVEKLSMIELANLMMVDGKKALNFRDAFAEISEMKGFTTAEKESNITQFYTDLNVDGRFITLGDNVWGLKRWYPVEQMDEEITNTPKKKKKTKKELEKEALELKEDAFGLIIEDDEEDLIKGFDDDEEEVELGFDLEDEDEEDFDEDDEDEEDDEEEVEGA